MSSSTMQACGRRRCVAVESEYRDHYKVSDSSEELIIVSDQEMGHDS